MAQILCLHAESSSASILEEMLWQAGHDTQTVDSVRAALEAIPRGGIDVVVADLKLPDAAGLEFLSILEKQDYDVPLIVATSYASILSAVPSVRAGVIQYIAKPIQPQQLELAVSHALEFVRLRSENSRLQHELTQLRSTREIIGESLQLKRVLQTMRLVAHTRAPVLLHGEPGTGKELLARTIHNLSPRRDEPFLTINCATLSESLVERTLFGYEKDAFAGAVSRVKGALERVHGGTLLLDEISALCPHLQPKLLRVIAEHEFVRVGGTDPIEVDVRIIATSNSDLSVVVEGGRFREDLYRQLSMVRIQVPPLRERQADIPLLAQHFAEKAASTLGKPFAGMAPEVVERLVGYQWPGNVRELALAVERAVILSPEPYLRAEALDSRVFVGGKAVMGEGKRMERVADSHEEWREEEGQAAQAGQGIPLVLPSLKVAEAEKVLIERALELTSQNRTRAAELLGISTRTLRNKLNKQERPSGA